MITFIRNALIKYVASYLKSTVTTKYKHTDIYLYGTSSQPSEYSIFCPKPFIPLLEEISIVMTRLWCVKVIIKEHGPLGSLVISIWPTVPGILGNPTFVDVNPPYIISKPGVYKFSIGLSPSEIIQSLQATMPPDMCITAIEHGYKTVNPDEPERQLADTWVRIGPVPNV